MRGDCIVCGKELEGRQQKYCSKRCRRTHENQVRDRKPIKNYTYTCLNCGKEFHPKAADRNKYCSRECAFEHKKAKPKVKIKQKHLCGCVVCGKEFEGNKSAKYCPECKKEKACYKSYLKNTAKPTECRWCGVIFIPEYKASTYVYCCDEHKDLAQKEISREHKHGITNAKRKRIYLRDGCKCRLCGKPMRMDMTHTLGTSNPHPLAPTIDHIFPKSLAKQQGWTKQQIHDDSNLQAAHWECNIKKGIKTVGEQLLLFG